MSKHRACAKGHEQARQRSLERRLDQLDEYLLKLKEQQQ